MIKPHRLLFYPPKPSHRRPQLCEAAPTAPNSFSGPTLLQFRSPSPSSHRTSCPLIPASAKAIPPPPRHLPLHLRPLPDRRSVHPIAQPEFALYVQDYGAPIGYRIATAHPDASPPSSCKTATPTSKASPIPTETHPRLLGRSLTPDARPHRQRRPQPRRLQIPIPHRRQKTPPPSVPDTWTLRSRQPPPPRQQRRPARPPASTTRTTSSPYPKWHDYFRAPPSPRC